MKTHLFRCSNCNAPLADLVVVDENPDINWNIFAECCHCGDKSYQKAIKGLFKVGLPEEYEKYTRVIGYDDSRDPIVIKTLKIGDYNE